MTKKRKTKTIVILVIGLITVTTFAVYVEVQREILLLRTKLAQEQMAISEDMRNKALSAEPKEAAGYLRYTVYYYPSGTKQISGSILDLMVEQVRSEMIRQIIGDLRNKTGTDLGNDPDKWIAKYGSD